MESGTVHVLTQVNFSIILGDKSNCIFAFPESETNSELEGFFFKFSFYLKDSFVAAGRFLLLWISDAR